MNGIAIGIGVGLGVFAFIILFGLFVQHVVEPIADWWDDEKNYWWQAILVLLGILAAFGFVGWFVARGGFAGH